MNTNNFTGFNGLDDLSIFEDFIYNLPHGSGIDCDWSGHCPSNGKYVYFRNSYHVMNENGFYAGYQDFTVRLDFFDFMLLMLSDNLEHKAAAMDSMKKTFTIQFNNGHYLADYYMLKEYLEDTIYWALSGLLEQLDFL